MRCAGCGSENPDEAKFCDECAAPLALRCAACGATNRPNAKFCHACAAPLTADPKINAQAPPRAGTSRVTDVTSSPDRNSELPEGERKTVAALYAVLTGTTKLMEELDDEEAYAIINPAFQLMIDAVHQYDGCVVHTFGDDFIALFGAPVAHEDHPQRAIHAALAARDHLRRRGEELRLQGRAGLEIRIRIHTGEVVMHSVLTGGHTEYIPFGPAVNVVERMRGVALADAIVVSAETRRLVDGYFELRGLGPAEIKGVADPIEFYEVVYR